MVTASSYWESRILADEEQAHRIADHASEEMAKVYRAQYLRVVKSVEELRDKLDYGKPLTRTELWNYARWTKVEESLRGYVSESSRINTDIIHKALDAEFKRVIGDESRNFGGALGRGGVMKLSPEAQRRILAGTWSGEHYSSRIWKNTAALADRMKNEITEMLVDGKSMPDIRRRLMYEFNVSYNNADRLARTEVSYVHNQATLERYRNSGATQLKVLIVEDGKTCDKCQALADQPYSIDKPPMVPVHPRCRCCYAPWTYTDRKEWAKKHPEENPRQPVTQTTNPDLRKLSPTPRISSNAHLQSTPQSATMSTPTEPANSWYTEHIAGKPGMEERYTRALAKAKEETDFFGDLKIPTMVAELAMFRFDAEHTRRKHDVSEEEARSYIDDAIVRVDRNDGDRVNYYGADGAAYVVLSDRIIRTAFKYDQYDAKTRKLIEVILRELGEEEGLVSNNES